MKLYEQVPGLEVYHNELEHFEGYCVAYFQHEVLIGLWKSTALFYHEPSWNKLQELHIFNPHGEYRAILSSRGFLLRRRFDSDVLDKQVVFDEAMCIIGNSSTDITRDEYFCATEAGRQIMLPARLQGKSILIRNYLTYDTIDSKNMPGCEIMYSNDWRYVDFVNEREA